MSSSLERARYERLVVDLDEKNLSSTVNHYEIEVDGATVANLD